MIRSETTAGSRDISVILTRLLDPTAKIDYLVAFAIGALPIGISLYIGAAFSAVDPKGGKNFSGYLDAPNWWSLALLLPAALFALRWLVHKSSPVSSRWPPKHEPPIIGLITEPQSKPVVYAALRRAILARSNLLAVLALVTIVTILDMLPVVMPYFSNAAPEQIQRDWISMYRISPDGNGNDFHVSKTENIALLVSAYTAQVAITFIGIMAIVVLLRHNLFFLNNVYQRRRAVTKPASELFQIDVKDVDRCFGFRRANDAFNSQVVALMLGGMATLLSRYAHAVKDERLGFAVSWPPKMPELSFPEAGQWLMAVAWLCALLIVALPAMVKLLPRIPHKQSNTIHSSIEHYLSEFFPEDKWPRNQTGKEESLAEVARLFASNAFWPSGDNRARSLFFFSYWIFIVLLVPPALTDPISLFASLLVFALLAYVATRATFKAIELLLGYVDQMLVTPTSLSRVTGEVLTRPDPMEKLNVGIFISYRRMDTVEYARSIHAELQKHFLGERLFRDLTAIDPGENFVTAINQSLSQVENIIILIGADWVSCTDDKGSLRLHKPEDMVRLEVETALKSNKRVIPVLVEGAAMPSSTELPEVLHPLCLLNALEITDSRWEYDVGRLVETLKTPVQSEEKPLKAVPA